MVEHVAAACYASCLPEVLRAMIRGWAEELLSAASYTIASLIKTLLLTDYGMIYCWCLHVEQCAAAAQLTQLMSAGAADLFVQLSTFRCTMHRGTLCHATALACQQSTEPGAGQLIATSLLSPVCRLVESTSGHTHLY